MPTRRQRRLPAKACVFCERTLDAVRGKRLIWSSAAGVVVRGYNDAVGRIPSRALLEPLPAPHSGVLIIWPTNDGAVSRALEQWTARLRPWSCQVCAHRVCERCGSPEKHPFGVDVVDDAGRVRHVPLLPGLAGCVREGCPG